MNREPDVYWMVHCPTQGPTRMVHATKEAAEREADRLARIEPGHIFYVLQTISAHRVRDPVERVSLEHPMIPF